MGRLLCAIAVLGLVGCSKAPPAPAPESRSDANSAPASLETKSAVPKTPRVPELTREDLELLGKDPSELTREERIKRAYARRRQIMQDPDSPAARALQDLSEAARSGTLQTGAAADSGPRFYLPGTQPRGGPPPAGVRPQKNSAPADSNRAPETKTHPETNPQTGAQQP